MADSITLQGTIRDFSPATNPDFEANFDPAVPIEKGIVGAALDGNYKPVYVGGTAAIKSTHGKAAFDQWYADDHTAKTSFSITLNKVGSNPDVYSYNNQAFFPIDNELLGNEGNPHNYHFTYELTTQFTYQGGEKFTFTGDDDLWVFIDNKLVIDLGGIHTQATETVKLDDLSGLTIGTNYSLHLFFAERHTTESHFRIDTSIVLTQPVATIVASDPTANKLGADTGEFTLNLDQAAPTDLTLQYAVAGTATEGGDDQPIGRSVLLPKGQTSAKITVIPIANQLTEGAKTVVVNLLDGSGYTAGIPNSATVTILDNPPPLPIATIVASDPQASEIGLDPGQFMITLNTPASTDLTLGYTVAGTATEGADYQPIGRSVLIANGQASAIIPVNPIADQLLEAPETVVVTLQPGNGYQLSPTLAATVTIADNPPIVIPPVMIPPVMIPIVTLTASDGTATKPRPGQCASDLGEFTISLDQPAPTNLVVNFSIAGTASEGQDCQPMPRSVTIASGQSQAKFPVVPMPLTHQRVGAGVTHVIATLQPSSGYQLGAKIADTVVIKLPVGSNCR